MLKIIITFSFLIIVFLSCQNENINEPYNYERDTPAWLKVKIDSMSINDKYSGVRVYRYDWNEKHIYHIHDFRSSVVIGDLFDQNGNEITLTDATLPDFVENKKNEILIWEWKNK